MVYIFEVLKHLTQALLAVLLAAQDFSSMFSVQGFFKEMFWNSKMYTTVETAYGSDQQSYPSMTSWAYCL